MIPLTLGCALATVAEAAPEPAIREARLAVIVGANVGDEGDVPLRYAELDALRMRDLLTELGDVAAARAILVRGGGPNEVRGAIREARGRAAELRDAGYRITFLFYYSGHGDQDDLHLPGGRLALDDLRRTVADVTADVRVVVLDACRGLGRTKGVHKGDEFKISALRGPQGSVEVRASAEGEAAQESDELRGSVFTHFLLSGLRGDADGDGDRRVTMAELYAYAYRRTLLRTQSGPVTQHATMDIDLEGAGELVLAVPGAAAATITVPPGHASYLVVAMPSAGVIGELTGQPGGLAVPAGRYLVVMRDGKRTRAAEVDLARGGTARLGAGDFHDVRRDQLVARGGWLELRRSRWRISGGTEVATSRVLEQPAVATRIGYGRVHGRLWWEVGAGGSYGPLDDERWTGNTQTLALTALAGWRLHHARFELALGGGVEVRGSRQVLHRRMDVVTNLKSFEVVEPTIDVSFLYGALGARGIVRLEIPMGSTAALALDVSGVAALRNQSSEDGRSRQIAGLILFAPSLAYVQAF
jgi:hypothetical protein